MNKNFTYILFITLFLNIFSVSNSQNSKFITEFAKSLKTLMLEKYGQYQINETSKINETSDFQKCNDSLFLNFSDSVNYEEQLKKLTSIIMYSGKHFNDLGSSYDCNSLNLSFYVIILIQEIENQNLTDRNLVPVKFLNLTRFLYGLCFPKECFNLLNATYFRNATNKLMNLTDYTVFSSYDEKENKDKEKYFSYYIFIILFVFLLLFLIIKIIAWIIVICLTHKNKYKLEQSEDENEDENKNDNKDDNNNENNNENNNVKNNENNKNNNKISNENIFRHRLIDEEKKTVNEEENSKIKNFFFNLNISLSFDYLISKKNKYYDSTNLEIFFFLRAISILFMSYAHNFYSMTKNPVPNMADDVEFYKSFSMVILKLSTFFTVFWIGLEGFEAAFKLFSYIKKHILLTHSYSTNISIKVFLKFFLYIIPSIIIFIFSFFTMGYGIEYFDKLSYLNLSPMLYYFVKDVNNYKCTKDIKYLFIPFKLNYYNYKGLNTTDDTDDTGTSGVLNRGFSNCYKYVNILYNIFYCYVLLLIIVYLALKIRKVCFEIFFIFFFFLSGAISYLFVCFFYVNDYLEKFKEFSFDFLLGENYSYKHTHLFLCYYFYGAMSGIIYFYYLDTLTNHPLITFDDYAPFKICFRVGKFLDTIKFRTKIIISVLCLLIITFLISWFYIKVLFDGNLLFNVDSVIYRVLDTYEKQFFLISSLILTLILLFHRDVTWFKAFYSNAIFIFIGRSSHFMLCTMDFIISMFYCLYNIVLSMDFMSTLIFALGQFCLCFSINVILNILIEQPVKIIIKKFIGNNDDIVNDKEYKETNKDIENFK